MLPDLAFLLGLAMALPGIFYLFMAWRIHAVSPDVLHRRTHRPIWQIFLIYGVVLTTASYGLIEYDYSKSVFSSMSPEAVQLLAAAVALIEATIWMATHWERSS